MLMVQVGDDVKHPEFGHGKIVGLIGPNQDDGVRIRLADGRVKRVMFTNEDPAQSKWRKVKKAGRRAESIVSELLDETPVPTAGAAPQSEISSVGIALEELEQAIAANKPITLSIGPASLAKLRAFLEKPHQRSAQQGAVDVLVQGLTN